MLKKILEFQNWMRKAIKNKYLPCIDVNTIWSNLWSFQKNAELREETCVLLKMAATHSTEAHKVGGAFGGEDAHYFLDLDMAVLGSSPDSYAEYRERIRGEYSFLSEPMYTALRLKVIIPYTIEKCSLLRVCENSSRRKIVARWILIAIEILKYIINII